MNWADIVIMAALLVMASLGSRIGVVRAACVFGMFILATVFGSRASVVFAERLGELVHDPQLGYIIAFSAAFLLTFIGLGFISSAICKIAEYAPLRWVDHGVGGVLGFLAGIVLVGLAIIYLSQSPVSNSEQWLDGSFLAPIIKAAIRPLFQEFLGNGDAASVALGSWIK